MLGIDDCPNHDTRDSKRHQPSLFCCDADFDVSRVSRLYELQQH